MEKIELYAGTPENILILVEKSAVKIQNCGQSAGKARTIQIFLKTFKLIEAWKTTNLN